MSNKVSVHLDGFGDKLLVYNTRAVRALEKELGGSIADVFAQEGKTPGITEVVALVWAGLHGAKSPLTVEDVVDAIPLSKVAVYGEKAMQALNESMGLELPTEEIPAELRPS